jgi:hypothetical protein
MAHVLLVKLGIRIKLVAVTSGVSKILMVRVAQRIQALALISLASVTTMVQRCVAVTA